LALKSVATVSSDLALKPWCRFFWFGCQNWQLRFGNLGLKITMTVSWFEPQNQVGDGLSIVPQNRQEDESAWGTRRDLATCFMWKQVTLEFPNLASRLADV
jgi:hypothetical protein